MLYTKPATAIQMLLLVLVLFCSPIISFGQTKIFTTSGSFTVPCDVTSISVTVRGAGGGGGGSTSSSNGGSGGGSGAYKTGTITVSGGTVINYTVGVGGTVSTGNGGAGGSTTFSTLTAGGGGGGAANRGTVGAGGTVTGGTAGNPGIIGTTSSGGNGGAAPVSGGAGGLGVSNGNGQPGNAYGSGGGGGERNGSTNTTGGIGGAGRIELTYTSALKTYCTPSFGPSYPITNVTFGSINNTTSNVVGGTPSLEQFCASTSVIQGSSSNAISVKGNTNGVGSNSVKVFIDWNQNGVFDLASNEEYDLGSLVTTTGIDGISVSGNIAVPVGATLGKTTMRVVKTYQLAPLNDPCYSGGYWGQAEDYVVEVLPCPTYSLSGSLNTATGACSNIGTSIVTLKGTAVGLPVGTYTVTYNTSSPAVTGLTATMSVSTAGTGGFTATGLTTAGPSTITVTNLQLNNCSNSISTSNTATLTVTQSNTVSAASSNPLICIGDPITTITHTTTLATGIGTPVSLPAGVTASWASDTITISGTPTEFGIFYYSIPLTGGCGGISATGLIRITEAIPAHTEVITNATCSTSTDGAITLLDLPRTPLYFKRTEHDYIDLGSSFLDGLTNFTLEGWVKFRKSDITGYQGLFGQNDSPEFYLTPTNLEFHSTVLDPSSWTTSTPLTAELGNNAWHHVAATGDTSQVKLYIDGVLMKTQGVSLINGDYGASGEHVAIGGGTIYGIGGGTPGDAFTGHMRKVGMYGITLSDAEIAALAASPDSFYTGLETGLLAGYNFTESSGNTLSSVPAGNDGTFGSGTAAPVHIYYYSWTGPSGFTASTKNISGLAPGEYTVTITAPHGSICSTTTSYIVGNAPDNTATAASSSADLCYTTGMLSRTHTTTGATGIVDDNVTGANGLPPGVKAQWASNTITISGTPSGLGTYNYSIPLTGGCGTASAVGTIIVNALPTTPTVGTISETDCKTLTASVVLSDLPAGDWTVNPGGHTGNTTTATITGLTVGTHNLTVTNASGCDSAATSNIVVNPPITNTWDGTAWSNGGALPTSFQAIVYNADYNSTSNIDGCTCLVNAGHSITFNSAHTLKITNEVVVNSTGSLLFENNSSLVQINNNAANSGNITYKRITPTILKTDYIYWSAPVSGFTLGAIQTGTYFYSYSSVLDNWVTQYTSTVMTKGVGYIVRGSGTWFDSGNITLNIPFIGAPNNGVVNVAVGGTDTSNLIGNPYPSAIEADVFLDQNSAVLLGTLYFWTHNTEIQERENFYDADTGLTTAGTGPYAYTSNDYATYNSTGGAGSSPPPSGLIASGVGFFADGTGSGGTVTFNNSMRVSGSNSQFFKTRNSKSSKSFEKNRVWLNMTNTQGAFKQALVGYITNATNAYEGRFDGVSFDGNEFIDFYSINEDKNLTIQGRSLPFDENDEVPLGYKLAIGGSFSVAIEQTDGLFENQDVFLEDKFTNTTVNLKSGKYTFDTTAGTFNDRFVLKYKAAENTLGLVDNDDVTNDVLVSNKNKQIKISANAEIIDKVIVYDLLGRQIYQKDKVNSSDFIIANEISSQQVLIVKTTLQNGKNYTSKISY